MGIVLSGLCDKCKNEKCRSWLAKNLDGIEGKFIVDKCEFFVIKE
jgi:hypothetical protein